MFFQLTAVKLACVCVFVWERERERESCTTNIRIDSLTIEQKTFLTYGCLCGESNTLDLLLFCKRVRVYTAETGKNCVWCERIQNFNFYSRLFVSLVVSLKENHAPVLSFFFVDGSAVPQFSIQCDLLSIVISALCFFVSRLFVAPNSFHIYFARQQFVSIETVYQYTHSVCEIRLSFYSIFIVILCSIANQIDNNLMTCTRISSMALSSLLSLEINEYKCTQSIVATRVKRTT